MSVGIRGFDGRRLREAREARAITGIALADTVGITRQAISQYESGATAPTPEVMERLANKLGLPVAFFLTPVEVDDTEPNVYFRSLSAATKSARVREGRRLGWQRHTVKFIASHVVLPEIQFPDFAVGDPTGMSDEQIDELATQAREYWQLRDGPIPDVVELLESRGAIVIRTSLAAESLDAYSAWLDGRPHVVLSDEKRSAVRSRYDCAHELGHLVLHRSVSSSILRSAAKHKQIERQAHIFAGAFLLPGSSFASEVVLPTLDGLLSLKPKWLVSVGAMIMRARALNLVDDEHERRLHMAYSSRGWRRREPFDDDLRIETPRVMRAAFDMAHRAGLYSIGQLRMSLPYSALDIEQLCSLPSGYLEGAQSVLVRLPAASPDIAAPTQAGRLVVFPGPRSN